MINLLQMAPVRVYVCVRREGVRLGWDGEW